MNRTARYLMAGGVSVILIAIVIVVALASASSPNRWGRVDAKADAPAKVKISANWPRLTISHRLGACAREDTGYIYTDRNGSRKSLVPSGAIAVTVCRYGSQKPPTNAPRNGLSAAGASTDAAVVDAIAQGLNAMTPASGAPTSCPQIFSNTIATFFYRSGSTDVVDVEGGCGGVYNGQLDLGVGGDAAQAQLQRLAKPVKLRWATIVGTCTPSCKGAQTVEATHDHVALGETWITYSGHFRMLVALSGRYALTLWNFNTIVSRTTANARIGHTTVVRFSLR